MHDGTEATDGDYRKGRDLSAGQRAGALWDTSWRAAAASAPLRVPAEAKNLPVRFGAEARQFSGGIDDRPPGKRQKKAIREASKMMAGSARWAWPPPCWPWPTPG